ncbi:MAG: DUF2721 domain-containing protein [Desulfobacteraceae bacterium]|jgi:hypothetical protein
MALPDISSATGFQTNPFIMLTFIVAPAVLTNACALLAMSTSNRFARAIDMAKEIARQIDSSSDMTPVKLDRLVNEFTTAETRGLLLLKAMRCFYLSLSCFALVALVSLLGSVSSMLKSQTVETLFLSFVLLLGVVAVVGIVYGVILLIREIRIVINVMQKRIQDIRHNIGTEKQ